ncbi:noroxomaritidine synthase 2-like [Elaeis guineensis]|uniref:noroxomaritidine synthase 2-like n=1 Tax=Elaeis guineensis var. tenera TaxID=51953 RepID=UPI003C6D4F56
MAARLLAASLCLLQTYPEILISVACFFFFYCYQKTDKGPGIPVNWPFVGMLPALLAHFHHLHDWSTMVLKETGCTFLFHGSWFSGIDVLFTCDPANVHHVFGANFLNYPKGDDFKEIFDILGDGIFNSDAESWRTQRMRAHNLISDQRFRSFVAQSSRNKVEKGLIPLLDQLAKQDIAVDLQDVFLRLTFDITSYLVFGADPGCLSIGFPTVPFAEAMDDATEALLFRHILRPAWWKLQRWLRIGKEKKLALAWEVMDQFITQRIAEKKEERNKSRSHEEAPRDLLSSYINDCDVLHVVDMENPMELDKFLRDTAMTFMTAGRDTTGTALTWFFWLLSKNPLVELKILEELKSLRKQRSCSDPMTVFDAEELKKLVYLHAALCESLRLYPPVPFEHKGVLQPEVLPSGHKAQPGTKILFVLYAMGRMEGVWGKDCLEFKPERWISEKGKLRHEPSYKFSAFTSGPRTCLGKDIAFTQMKAVVAAMVYNFHVDVVEGHVVEPKISIILHMKNGLMVRIRKRASA